MSVIIKAIVNAVSDNVVGGAEQMAIQAGVSFCYTTGGVLTAVNTTTVVYVTGANLLTGLLIDDEIRSAVKDFVHDGYGIASSLLSVLLSGGFNIPLL